MKTFLNLVAGMGTGLVLCFSLFYVVPTLLNQANTVANTLGLVVLVLTLAATTVIVRCVYRKYFA